MIGALFSALGGFLGKLAVEFGAIFLWKRAGQTEQRMADAEANLKMQEKVTDAPKKLDTPERADRDASPLSWLHSSPDRDPGAAPTVPTAGPPGVHKRPDGR